nr:EOG090X07NG [Ilyocryptus agilis]
MSPDQHQQIPTKVLDDLCSRFIINIPAEQREDLVRVLFAVELAHWFFIDFYCEDYNDLHVCNIKEFAQQIFQHCPFLRDYVHHLDAILSRWRGYKLSVPTYGAVLIDPTYEHVLLVRGFYNRESWGFPKGKVQENESPLKCAIREVMEEVGFDMKDRAYDDQYLERDLNGQLIRLYIVKQVPLETKFAPKTKNEIKEMRWFRISDLPCHRRDATPQVTLGLNPKAFFMVIPFIKDLRRWINQERGIYSSSNGDSDNANEYIKRREQANLHHHQSHYQYHQMHHHYPQQRRRTTTYHGAPPVSAPSLIANTRQPTILQKLFGVDHQTSSFIRDDSMNDDQRKNTRKIAANLNATVDEPTASPAQKLQTQLSVQDTIQRHFCQILKNDSLTVTDQTSITETLLMRETSSGINLHPLTPPMSNDDENKRPATNKSNKTPSTDKEKKGQVQYRILPRGQPDEPTPSTATTTPKKLHQETNAGESTSLTKSQRNRLSDGIAQRNPYGFESSMREIFVDLAQ